MLILLWILIGALYMAGILAFSYKRLDEFAAGPQSMWYSAFGVRPSRNAALLITFIIGTALWPAIVVLKLLKFFKT